jgi:hypothetical protein
VLRKGKEPAAHALGFKVASEADVDPAAFWFKRRNLPVAVPQHPREVLWRRVKNSRPQPFAPVGLP